jgi:3-hydroxybutyryl-CoA dehydrogenase
MPTYGKIAILGAGLMGHALAIVHALGGSDVMLNDVKPKALARAPSLIETALRVLTEATAITAAEASAARGRIFMEPLPDQALAGADLVVEAVLEDAGVKREAFVTIDRAAPPDAVIASNTSNLDIFPLVPEGRLPRTLIAHWYTPPYIIDLVDVVGGERTDPAIVDQMRAYLTGLGKRPVVFRRFINGYVANRLQAAMHLEISRLLDEGYATPEDVDASIRHGLAQRMALLGHCMKADYTGLLLMQKGLANRTYAPPIPQGRSETLDRLIADGRTGVMAGAGFFDYGGRSPEDLFEERDRKLLALKRAVEEIDPA